jgi:carbonic anhydrase
MEHPNIAPDDAIALLTEGNARYLTNASLHPNMDSSRRSVTASQGQHPFASVLSCSDSRVPVEFLFDRGIGDVFVVRVAGNVLGPSEKGSIEYALDRLGIRLFVVLGHSKCGAVKAVFQEGLLPGNLRPLSEKILCSVDAVKTRHTKASCSCPSPVEIRAWEQTPVPEASESAGAEGEDFLIDEAARLNVWNTIKDTLLLNSRFREKIKDGTIKVTGAFYDIDSGEVAWMGQHPKQAELVGA